MIDSSKLLTTINDRLQLPADRRKLAVGCAVGMFLLVLILVSGRSYDAESSPEAKRPITGATPTAAREEPREDTDRTGTALTEERERLQKELENLKLKQEVAALRRELDRLQTSEVSAPARPATPAGRAKVWRFKKDETETASTVPVPETMPTPAGERTLAYWNSMNDIIEREGQIRAVPLGGITSASASGFFDARIRAAEFAVSSLTALDTQGVDKRAVAVAASVAEWYKDGRSVAETGRSLLSRGSTDERKGAAGQQYQSSEWTHSSAVDAVNAEGERIRQLLSEDYGIAFPPLK